MTFTVLDQADFAELITEFGAELTFTRKGAQVENPDTGEITRAKTTYTANCVRDSYSVMERTGTNIKSTDIRLLAEAGDYQVNDLVDIDGAKGLVIAADPVKPGSIVMIYELQVRI